MHKILMIMILAFIAGDYAMAQVVVTPPPDGCNETAPPPTCTDPAPAPQVRTQSCPTGTTGSWQQSSSYVAAPYPTCWVAGTTWLPDTAPAGACVTAPPPVSGTPCLSTGTLTVGANLATTCKFELMTTDAQRAAAKAKALLMMNQQVGRKYFEERWVKLKTPLTAGWTWNAGCDRHLVNWKRTGAPNNMGLWSSESVNCKTTKIMSSTVVPIPTGARTEDWYVRVVWAQNTPGLEDITEEALLANPNWDLFKTSERKFGIWRNGELMTGEFLDPRQAGANQRTSNLVSEFHGEFITYPVFIDAKTIYYDIAPLPVN